MLPLATNGLPTTITVTKASLQGVSSLMNPLASTNGSFLDWGWDKWIPPKFTFSSPMGCKGWIFIVGILAEEWISLAIYRCQGKMIAGWRLDVCLGGWKVVDGVGNRNAIWCEFDMNLKCVFISWLCQRNDKGNGYRWINGYERICKRDGF